MFSILSTILTTVSLMAPTSVAAPVHETHGLLGDCGQDDCGDPDCEWVYDEASCEWVQECPEEEDAGCGEGGEGEGCGGGEGEGEGEGGDCDCLEDDYDCWDACAESECGGECDDSCGGISLLGICIDL